MEGSPASKQALKDRAPEVLSTALVKALEDSRTPGAVAYVGDRDGAWFQQAQGWRQVEPERLPVEAGTPYDLASLTKAVATTTAVMLLRDEGALLLDDPVHRYVPIPAFQRFTLRQLLTHTSGLVAGRDFYKEVTSLDQMLARYAALDLESAPGTRWRYSDVGFMLLGRVVEMAAHDRLDAFCRKRIFAPLGMTRTAYNPPAEWASQCAATENCPWRKRLLVGVVHDENAYAVGGVSGHAGLFSTASDLATFALALMDGKILKEATLDEMTRAGQVPFQPRQGLGWWLDSWTGDPRTEKCIGFLPVRSSFGFSGWTGTSLWMDRATGRFAILLGNTCHPTRATRDNDTFRRTFYTAVAQTLYPGRFATHSGLDRLVDEDFSPLRGKRIALLTHRAAVDRFGRSIFDVFRLAPDLDLRCVYSPEHGLKSQAEAGAQVKEQQTIAAPVISLYGEQKRPTPDQLAGIDYFVVDLQDVGARYYTYAATLKECMAACAAASKPMLILDRPNPVGGDTLEGPIATDTTHSVCWGNVPIRHGMTLGEIARYFQGTDFAHTPVQVIVKTLDGWPRTQLFADCDLPWVPPSPNIPTPETALVYIGTCLFEGTNLNEGRGTDTPFQLIGAPWLDAKKVIKKLDEEDYPGCRLEAVKYTPQAIPGKAANPLYRDEECEGIRITVEKPQEVRAFRTAVALLCALHDKHPKQFQWKENFDVLAGGTDLRQRIEAGQSPKEILAAYTDALQSFATARPKIY
jgi:uncharacterized protein YbbC (DUF1343 family)/CubicO group peptidase (beta-lactamase class C family)